MISSRIQATRTKARKCPGSQSLNRGYMGSGLDPIMSNMREGLFLSLSFFPRAIRCLIPSDLYLFGIQYTRLTEYPHHSGVAPVFGYNRHWSPRAHQRQLSSKLHGWRLTSCFGCQRNINWTNEFDFMTLIRLK